ncbi:MAG: TonB-dependent receptor [Caulobacterales bacterium]|nr:TonB-dependent receptor [Caulobacterales bacterium]
MLDRKILLGTTMIAGIAALAVAVPAVSFAQTTPAPATTTADDDDDTEVEALVVTGSRIKRSEFTSSAPIQVITAEQSTLEGLIDTAEILQGSSVASGSFQVNNQLTGFVTDGGPGARTLSLRGLGANRTLILLNGRRVGPAGTRGTVGPVDLNVIPQSIVERFEILKDGASSIYGSDAVAGVANIITRSNFDGFEVTAFASQPFEQGGESYRVNASWGRTFDRGYVNVSADWAKQEVLRREDRDDTACLSDYLFNAGRTARVDFPNTDPGQSYADDTYKCNGLFSRVLRTGRGDMIYPDAGVTYPTAAQGNSFTAGNAPIPFGLVRQRRAGFAATYPYAHMDDEVYARASAISPSEITTVFASGGYDLTPTTELYGELLFNRRESTQYGARQFFPTVGDQYANIPAGWAAAFSVPLNQTFVPIIPLASDRDQEVNYWRGVAGIRGDFGSMFSGWDWDIFYQYSSSDADYGADIIYNDRVLATTGGFRTTIDPTTIPVFPAVLPLPTPYGAAANVACFQPHASLNLSGFSCADLPSGVPWTDARILNGDFNAAERAFLFTHEYGNTTYTQEAVEGSVTGNLFDLPAGPVGAAFGFAWRRDEIDDTPGANERAGYLWGSTSSGRSACSDTVKVLFGELDVPLIKGLPGIESLDLQASARYTDYDSYGSDSTHKFGLNWQITPSWRIRATDGTSFRAPALYELYLANQTSFLGQGSVDPCIDWENDTNPFIQLNCAAAGVPLGYTTAGTSSATIVTGGGLGILKAETSEAQTLGVIWTPDFIDLSVAVDYFEILVNDEVRQFGAGNIVNQCYSSPNFATEPFCTLVNRYGYNPVPGSPPPSAGNVNAIQLVNNSYVNVAEQVNRGMDLTIRYQHEFDFGRLTLDGQFTWQFEDTVELLSGAATEDFNGTTFNYDGPDFTGNIRTRFDRGDWTVTLTSVLLGKGSDTEVFGGDVFFSGGGYQQNVYFKQYAEFTAYHHLSVRWKHDDWTFLAGVRNVFDERPPSQSTGQFRIGTAANGNYDLIGRRAFFEVTKKW